MPSSWKTNSIPTRPIRRKSRLPTTADGKALIELARKQLQTLANFNLDVTLRQWEKSYVEAALNMTHGNLSQAAKLLGINRTTLYSRMQTYGTE